MISIVIITLCALVAMASSAYLAWSSGVLAGHFGQRCEPDAPAVLHAVWIAGYAVGAEARVLERESRRVMEER